MSLTRLGLWTAALGLVITLVVRAPDLIARPDHHVLRVWIDCREETWPADLAPVLAMTLAEGRWTHNLRFKAFEQDSQYLQADCTFDKIEATRPFTVFEMSGAVPVRTGVNGLWRLDIAQVDPVPERTLGRRDGLTIVFGEANDLGHWAGVAERRVLLSAQYAVSLGDDEPAEAPGARNIANVPFPALPVILRADRPVETNATALGRGTGRSGDVAELTYELARGELDVTLRSRTLAVGLFVLGLLGPALFGFGTGIFTARLKEARAADG